MYFNALLYREIGFENARSISDSFHAKRFPTIQLANDIPSLPTRANASILGLDIDQVEEKYLISSTSKGEVYIHDLEERRRQILYPSRKDSQETIQIATAKIAKCTPTIKWYTIDTGMFFTGSFDGLVRIWDTNEMKVTIGLNIGTMINEIDTSEENPNLIAAVGPKSNLITLCDLRTGASSHTLSGHKMGCTTVKWKGDGANYLLSGGEDGTIRYWDIRKAANCIFSFDQTKTNRDASPLIHRSKSHFNYPTSNHFQFSRAHSTPIIRINIIKDGGYLLSLSTDDLLRVWDLHSGANSLISYKVGYSNSKTNTLSMINRTISSSDDCDHFCVTVGGEAKIYSLSKPSDAPLSLSAHYGEVCSSIFFSPYEEIYTSGTDGNILVYSPQEEEEVEE